MINNPPPPPRSYTLFLSSFSYTFPRNFDIGGREGGGREGTTLTLKMLLHEGTVKILDLTIFKLKGIFTLKIIILFRYSNKFLCAVIK